VNPILSIIIPVYKVEDYIGQCLQSVFDGGLDENLYEVVVVNDGTPDKSMDVVRKVCGEHGNVKIAEQENQGLSAARMTGLSQANGDYVWFVDSDDWLKTGALNTIFQKISQNPEADVFAMPLIWIGAGEEQLDYQIDVDTIYQGKELLKTSYPLWAAQRYIIKRDIFNHQELSFPFGLLHEDEYFYRILLYNTQKVLLMSSSMYYYRQRENSIMGGKSIRSFYDVVSIYKLLEGFLHRVVAAVDFDWFQKDIFSLLVRNFRDSYYLKDKEKSRDFRRKNGWFVFSRGMRCRALTIKERMWIICLVFFPRILKINV
jgi:glycosyltransferase involved in cell wall biosynthesis